MSLNVGVHESAQAYQKVSQTFERGRPEYTIASIQTLVQKLGVNVHSKVLDLGAGTGKFTKHLVEICPNVMAVEPVSSMRETMARNLPKIKIVDGSAESIPAADESFDTVFVANAFHWFNAPKALIEIHRVLSMGGGLGLIWINDGVFSSEWGKLIDQMLPPYESLAPRRESGEWLRAFQQSDIFSPIQKMQLHHVRETTHELVIDRIASLSFVAALPELENKNLLAQVKELIQTHPMTRGQSVLRVGCSTDIYWCFRSK